MWFRIPFFCDNIMYDCKHRFFLPKQTDSISVVSWFCHIFFVSVHFSHASCVSMCVSIVVQHVSLFRLVFCMFPYLSVSSRICPYVEQFSVCYCFPSLFLMFFHVTPHISVYAHLFCRSNTLICIQFTWFPLFSIRFPRLINKFSRWFSISQYFLGNNPFPQMLHSPENHVSTSQRYWLIFEKQHKSRQHSQNAQIWTAIV